jgi:hypothetical protein
LLKLIIFKKQITHLLCLISREQTIKTPDSELA